MCFWSNCSSKIDAAMQFFVVFCFLLSEIPDGKKRSEMVVNLILRYEKNGIWIEYIIPHYGGGGTAYIR
jgi:hypothetical protein